MTAVYVNQSVKDATIDFDSHVTGNRIDGFDTSVYDDGDDSMIRGTPAPPQEI
ncbi:hypothetical protein [Fodinibius sp.]|uniref:hypothetical protein n=1 Tax=Fodinibius sp. TaxID=1872440 RepID=UPI00356A8AEA